LSNELSLLVKVGIAGCTAQRCSILFKIFSECELH